MALRTGYPRTPENDAFLMALFDQLEDEKAILAPTHPALTDDGAGRAYVLQFASRIFLTADDEDRAGKATKKTARLFLVASQFLEVLRVFEENQEGEDEGGVTMMGEVEERIRYARWKAMDIVKALNEGRVPAPGPPGSERADNADDGEQQKESPPSTMPSYSGTFTGSSSVQSPPPNDKQSHDYQQHSPTYQQQPPNEKQSHNIQPPNNQLSPYNQPPNNQQSPYNQPPNYQQQPPTYQSPPPPPTIPKTSIASPTLSSTSASATATGLLAGKSRMAMVADAEKHARYAVSALQFEDFNTAIKELEYALTVVRHLQD